MTKREPLNLFVQRESLARKFLFAVLLTSMLFVLSSVAMFISSRTLLRGLADLDKTYEMQDSLRQIQQMIFTFSEVLQRAQGERDRSANLIRMSREQLTLILEKAAKIEIPADEIKINLGKIRQGTDAYLNAADKLMRSPTPEQRLIVEHLELELTDHLAQLQIALKAHADDAFARLYSGRYKPLISGAILGLIFMGFSLTLGLRLRHRMTSAIANLLKATQIVAGGNLNYQARVLHQDEIGHLTDAFNQMTKAMQQSTVSREYVETILESVIDAVIVTDEAGRITHLNEVTSRLFGYSKNELLGEHYGKLIVNARPLTQGLYDDEMFAVTKLGAQVPVEISYSALSKKTGGIPEYVIAIRDITDRKRIEKDLKAKNAALMTANKEIEAFSYSVSHDLRAPLRGVDGFSQALLEDLGPRLQDQHKNYLQRIRAGVQKMGRLIDDMLSLSKLSRQEMKVEVVNLTAIADEIFGELREQQPERQVDIHVTRDMVVEADPNLMRALLENLLGNAWKYTSKTQNPKIEFGWSEKDGHKVFHVKDNGAGFDMTYADRLFGAFQRLHREQEFPGTGVGLAIAQRIVHRHGGAISAIGDVGKGAAFFFTLHS